MSNQTPIDQIAERVERLLGTARARVDALLERLPDADALAAQKTTS
jgi:hypothetical protein